MNADYVSITQGRYEELLDTETRMDVLTDQLINGQCLRMEDCLRIIGTPQAIARADELREEEKKMRIKELEKYGEVIGNE